MKTGAPAGILAGMPVRHGRPPVLVVSAALLGACTALPEREFAVFVGEYASAPPPAAGDAPWAWVTETTVWPDAAGYDRTVSCTTMRSYDWFAGRGYGLLPAPDAAARAGLVVTRNVHSPTTADVLVGRPMAPPDAIYSFYRDGDEWQLAGVEVVRREPATAPGAVPDWRCAAGEP
jgi:hypothetical protein